MFNLRTAVLTLAATAAAGTFALSAPASALSWKQHACWCKQNRSRLHGLTALGVAAVSGPGGAIMTRAQITRHAIHAAERGYRDQAFALFLRCQAHNRNAAVTLLRNRYAVTRWLVDGGPC